MTQARIYHFTERAKITARLVGGVLVYTVEPLTTERTR